MPALSSSVRYARQGAGVLLGTVLLVQCSSIHLDRALKHQPEAWPMYGRVPSRTNTTREILRPPLEVAWEQDISGGVGNGSPVLADSLVLVGTMRGELYAINAFTGKRYGWVDFGEAIHGAPVITENTAIVACSYTQESLSAFNLTEGHVRWKHPCGDIEASVLLLDANVYVANTQGVMFCIKSSDGGIVWKYELPDNTRRKGFHSAPAAGDGIVVAGGDDGAVYAWDPESGTLRWRYATGGSIAAPAAIADSTVFIGSLTGEFYALGTGKGDLRWRYAAEGSFYGGPCLIDNLVVVGTTRGVLLALDAVDGTLRWTRDLGGVINSSAVAAGRVLYVGTLKKQLFAVDARDGALLWSHETKGRIKTSPAIAHQMLYVATDERSLLAFREAGK